MRSTLVKRLLVLSVLVCLIVPAAAKSKKQAAAKDAEDQEESNWDVANPPGPFETITIDTTETTWSCVDVSPDGRQIIFDMLGDIYAVPMEGGEAQPLTSGIPWNFQPRFSPDGRHIAFISDRAGGDNLWVMNADGSEPRAITEEKEHLVHNPYWSPDGNYIAAKKAFTSTRSIPAGEIWLFHVGGGEGLQITERPNGPKDQKTMASPAFSHDGRYIYYSQDTTPGLRWQYNKDATGQIFVIQRLERDTGKIDRVASGPGGAIVPTPSPDGKTLAFVKRLPGLVSALYLKDLESGKEWPVYDRMDRDLQETNGSQGNAPAFAWTPDAGSLIFWSGGKIRRVDVITGEASVIPVHIKTEKKISPALRFPVDVAPDPFRVRMPRWAQYSPAGDKVVFQALGHLYIRDVASGQQHRLTSDDDHFEFYPSFSRDGRQVVYTSWNDQALGSVRMISVDGVSSRVLTDKPGHYIEPRFSPDGSKVVYRKITGGYLLTPMWSTEPGIYVVPTAGGETSRLVRAGSNAHFGADPDRVYYSQGVEDTKLVLKSVNLQGHDERTHLEGSKTTEFHVSPDGGWVAFTEQYNAFVAPFTATGRTVEIGSSSKAIPVKQVSKRSGEFLHWSADSRQIHWAHGATLYTRELLDAFDFLAGSPEELPEPVTQGLDLGFDVSADVPSGRVAIVGGQIVTMRDAGNQQEVIENGIVLVNGNRIEAVGAYGDVQIPADTRMVHAPGMTILPGLVDAHAHGTQARSELTPQQNWLMLANLAFGVTTIHDPSNDTSSIFSAAELQRSGALLAPRIFSTGTILYGAHAPGWTAEIESLEDATFHVRRLQEVGAISVKSYQQPRRDQRQMVIAAARELGMMVVPEGGAKFQHNMNEIVDGHTGIEHALSVATCYDDVLQLWSKSETGYTPTFVVAYGGLTGETYWYQHTQVWNNQRLMQFSPRFIIEPASMRRTKAPEDHYNHFEVGRFAKKLADLGVSVQIGAHGQRAGLAAHWEIWMMVQGGFTPWEAFRGATIDGARYLGLDDDIGSIEPGKLADLILVEGSPLENIRHSEQIAYTMLNGRLYDAATMNQLVPDPVSREPLFFKLPGGDTIHPATTQWLERLRQGLGWVH